MCPDVPIKEVWICVAVGARWRFTTMAVRTISEMKVPVLAVMMETMRGDGIRRVHHASSLLPRPILSAEDRFFAKAMRWSRRWW